MADTARDHYVELLLEKIDADIYPSVNQLDLVESVLGPDELDGYIAILLRKVADEPYPSIPMLQRLQRLVLQAG